MEQKKKRRLAWLYAFGRGLLRPFFFPIYRIRVEGRENIPAQGSLLLCSNHVSMKDPIVLGIVQKRRIYYMAKEELFRTKFMNGLMRGLGAFPVTRGSGGDDALRDAYALLEREEIVGIFIEGHRSKTGELQKPKTGAAMLAYRTKAPVLPVCITGEGGKLPKPFRRLTVTFGKVIPAEELHLEDDSSSCLRHASRQVMEEIKKLREQTLQAQGVLPQAGEGSKTE